MEDIDKEYSRQFLIAQHAEMNQDLRHLDNRITTAGNLYIGIWTIVITATAILYSELDEAEGVALSPLLSLGLLVLVLLGIYTTNVIRDASVARARRQMSINLVKRFFEERAPEIADYSLFYLMVPEPLKGTDYKSRRKEERAQRIVQFPNTITYFIYTLNSILAGWAIHNFGVWLNPMNKAIWVVAVIVAIVVFWLQSEFYKRSKGRQKGYRARLDSQ